MMAEGAAILSILLIVSNAAQGWLLYLLMGLLGWRLVSWRNYRQRLAAGNAPPAALKILDGIDRPQVILGYALGKLQKGRPTIKPPVRREKDKFVFNRD